MRGNGHPHGQAGEPFQFSLPFGERAILALGVNAHWRGSHAKGLTDTGAKRRERAKMVTPSDTSQYSRL